MCVMDLFTTVEWSNSFVEKVWFRFNANKFFWQIQEWLLFAHGIKSGLKFKCPKVEKQTLPQQLWWMSESFDLSLWPMVTCFHSEVCKKQQNDQKWLFVFYFYTLPRLNSETSKVCTVQNTVTSRRQENQPFLSSTEFLHKIPKSHSHTLPYFTISHFEIHLPYIICHALLHSFQPPLFLSQII